MKVYDLPANGLEHEYKRVDTLRRSIPEYEVPDWCVGAYIDWNWKYDSEPGLMIQTNCDIGDWEGKRWVYNHLDGIRKHPYYYAGHPDGRAEIHYHGIARLNPQGIWETTKSEGYGGRTFTILMDDGRTVNLRGPWHGTSPKDLPYVDISYGNVNGKYTNPLMYFFGVKIHVGLWLAIADKFVPEHKPMISRHHPDDTKHLTFWKPSRECPDETDPKWIQKKV